MSVVRRLLVIALVIFAAPTLAHATPYASGFSVTGGGTTVNFVINEDADAVTYRINGGGLQVLDPSKGAKSITLGSASDTYDIIVQKTDTVGYTIPTGGPAIAADANGLFAAAPAAGFRLISSDANVLDKFNSPRGLAVSNNPNAPNFGTTYVSNSAAGATGGRTLGDGMYALKADQTDATGNGNTASNPGAVFVASASAPWRNFVGPDGQVYVADFTDSNGNVYVMNPGLTTAVPALNGIGGPSVVPATRKHGSSTAVYVQGSLGGGNLQLYTIDEDLTELTGTGAGDNVVKLNVWRYDINSGPYPFTGAPTKINGAGTLLINGTDELIRGADGKYYLSQLRSAGTDAATVLVLDASGAVIFNSFTASGGVQDILRNAQGMAVSEDQKWMALMLNNSDVAVIPLVNGIPDMANRMVVDTGTNVNSGRDIAFDAAGNIHYASSGQGLYRVLSAGGTSFAATSFDGSSYSFQLSPTYVPESKMIAALGAALVGVCSVWASRRSRSA